MTTLGEALEAATAYWGNGKGGRVQAIRAQRGVSILGGPSRLISTLKGGDGTLLLTTYRNEGLAPETLGAYYASVKTMLKLAGAHEVILKWPKAPKKPRGVTSREPISDTDLETMVAWLQRAGYQDTADLALLLKGTGLRVDVEALDRDALRYTDGPDYGTLEVTGKGDNVRVIPVVDPAARAILNDPATLAHVRATSYKTHLARWNRGLKATGVNSKGCTFHAIRHAYVTSAYRKSGGDIMVAKELAGHSSPTTTARYIGVDVQSMVNALGA